MTDVFILLKNFDNEGWETYSITTTFETACKHAQDGAKEYGKANVEFCVEHWILEDGAFLGATELDLENIEI